MTEHAPAPPPLPAQWFVALDGQLQGPLTLGDLAGLARQGKLLPQTLVWKEGMAQWCEAHAVPEAARLLALPAETAAEPGARPQLQRHGLPWWAVLLVVLGGAFVFYMIMAVTSAPKYLEALRRAPKERYEAKMKDGTGVARARADLRVTAIALETYYLDNNAYPACAAERDRKAQGQFLPETQPGFLKRRDRFDPLFTLTTPIAYIKNYFPDPFAPTPGATFCYWTPGDGKQGFIVWSAGPDGVYDLSMANIRTVHDPTLKVPTPALIALTYDPSNGARSRGDIWRLNEYTQYIHP